MGAKFYVKRCYWVTKRDWIVMTGVVKNGPIFPGMYINLPRELHGPGPVPIGTMEEVELLTGTEFAITFEYRHLESAPLFEPSWVEGRWLDVVPESAL